MNVVRKVLSSASVYNKQFPTIFTKANGCNLYDENNKKYIDCMSCAGVLALGHNHPTITSTIEKFMSSNTPFQTMDIITPYTIEFLQKLNNFLPSEFSENSKIHFCSPSGGDAVEAALKLCKIKTKRSSIISFQGAYHGMTTAGMSMIGRKSVKDVIGSLPSVNIMPYPNHRSTMTSHQGSMYIKEMIQDDHGGIQKPAAMIFETLQGEGGVNLVPNHWVQDMRKLTIENDIPLIIDEIQTGLCRTGKKFGFQHSGIKPDIICISKALGGGFPMAVIAYNDSMETWETGHHSGTFRGNQIAMATGIATLDFMENERLWEHVDSVGRFFMNELKLISEKFEIIGSPRGRGLMVGFDVIGRDGKSSQENAIMFQKECMDAGLIVPRGGRMGSTIRFLPPLIISKEQLEETCSIIENVCRKFKK